jgi:hypothetical protein
MHEGEDGDGALDRRPAARLATASRLSTASRLATASAARLATAFLNHNAAGDAERAEADAEEAPEDAEADVEQNPLDRRHVLVWLGG